jgi:peptidyl-prolyl cis-trans isomerase B (cyclophilin B)
LRRALGITLLCLTLPLAACGSDNKDTSTTTSSSSQQGAPTSRGCTQVSAPPQQDASGHKKPKSTLDPSKKWELQIDTNCGSFTIALDPKASPHATASLVALAKEGYFDGTGFTRIVPTFVIQGGDPTGTGDGDPGYTTVDKPAAGTRYTKGVVAMAKGDSDPRGDAGSQFFIVTGADTGLPPDYALVGRVTKGLDVVERIGRLGDPATEQPTQPVVMSKVTVKQG